MAWLGERPLLQWRVDDVVAVVTDLYFQSRIAAAARAAGRSVRFVITNQAAAEASSGRVALIDLDARLDVLQAIQDLRAGTDRTIVAFGPHLDTEGRKAARAAGADRVLAKSKFATELPHIMNEPEASGSTAGQVSVDEALGAVA